MGKPSCRRSWKANVAPLWGAATALICSAPAARSNATACPASGVRDFSRISPRLWEQGDQEIFTRITAYEMAYRMQSSAPELIDLSGESAATLKLYGLEQNQPSFARNCLLARRLVERGVRFVQLYHTNWDSHGGPGENLQGDLEKVCRDVDQAQAALIKDP